MQQKWGLTLNKRGIRSEVKTEHESAVRAKRGGLIMHGGVIMHGGHSLRAPKRLRTKYALKVYLYILDAPTWVSRAQLNAKINAQCI